VLFDLLPVRQSYCNLPLHPPGDYRIYLVVLVIILLVAAALLVLCVVLLWIRKSARGRYQTLGTEDGSLGVSMREIFDGEDEDEDEDEDAFRQRDVHGEVESGAERELVGEDRRGTPNERQSDVV
jgi:hypothetical protein